MADKLLISIEDIKNYRPMADIIQTRIDPYIQEAQMNDLKPFLGDPLYLDLLTNTSTTENQDLLYGKNYTDYSGYNIRFNGIIPMLVYFSLARIISNNQINITSFGAVQKVNQSSTPLDNSAIKMQITELRSNAISYQNEARTFLDINMATYPKWNYSRQAIDQSSGLKFFKL